MTSFRDGLATIVLKLMTLQKQINAPEEAGCLAANLANQHACVYRHGDLERLQELVQQRYAKLPTATAARTRVLQKFDWRVVAAKLDRVYLREIP